MLIAIFFSPLQNGDVQLHSDILIVRFLMIQFDIETKSDTFLTRPGVLRPHCRVLSQEMQIPKRHRYAYNHKQKTRIW